MNDKVTRRSKRQKGEQVSGESLKIHCRHNKINSEPNENIAFEDEEARRDDSEKEETPHSTDVGQQNIAFEEEKATRDEEGVEEEMANHVDSQEKPHSTDVGQSEQSSSNLFT